MKLLRWIFLIVICYPLLIMAVVYEIIVTRKNQLELYNELLEAWKEDWK